MLDTSLRLHDENACLAYWVRDMFRTHRSIKNVTRFKNGRLLFSSFAEAHLDTTIKDSEDLLPVIDVPFVWLIRPMKTCGDATHIRDIECSLRAAGCEFFGSDDLHSLNV